MKKIIKPGNYSFWGMVLLTGILLFSCSSNSTTIRIKADKNRSVREKAVLSQSEQPLNQRVLTISSGPKQTKDELLANRVNQVLNHFVKAEELIAEGKLVEAEEEILRASSILESREVWSVLVKIYEKTGNKTKADSCKKLLNSLKPMISSENVPID